MNQAFPKHALVAGTMCSLVKRVDPALPEDGGPVVVCSCAGEERYLTEARWLEMAADFRQHAGGRGIVTSQSPAREKIALFRSLFSGRPDVHAHGFRKKDGGIGYAPACANEWRRGVCPRAANSKAKCSGCPCQAFDELSDQAIVRHFKGEDEGLRDVLGLYVLDADSNTSVLVMDFDEGDWKGAVAAVRAAGRAHGVEACVERSRSGNGGHVWFFFERAIPAKLARDFGSALITEAMAAARSVSFDAYDRMFPAQSTVPEGGFGNLIAAPFQGRAQRCGNSVFVDENFEPYVDQWLFLSQVKRLGEQEVQAIAAVPGPTSPKTRNDAAPPWGHGVAGPLAPGDFPDCLAVTQADMLYIPLRGLSPRAAARIERLAAFANPEFLRRQAAHRAVYGVPRVVYLGETRDDCIALPRGCKPGLLALLDEAGVRYVLDDRRQTGDELRVSFKGALRPEQEEAARCLLKHEDGILSAPTGFGKTVVGAYLVAQRRLPTLVIVPKTALVAQWVGRLGDFLDVEDPRGPLLTPSGRPSRRKRPVVGQIGGGKRLASGLVDVATFQSLVEKDPDTGEVRAKDLLAAYGMIICDECHHAAAPQLEIVLKSAPARYVYGLSATPRRADGLERALFMLCGPVRCAIDPKEQARQQGFRRLLRPRFTGIELPGCDAGVSFNQVLDELCEHEARNELIARDVAEAAAGGRAPLVLTKRKGHARALAELISRSGACDVHLLVGEGTASQRREKLAAAVEATAGGSAIVATESYLGEGFDASALDALFLATPISWDGNVTQQAGRLHRTRDGKTDVVIYDYVDVAVPMLERMYKKRLRTYARLGYEVAEPTVGEQGGKAKFVLAGDALSRFADDVRRAARSVVVVVPYAVSKAVDLLTDALADAVTRGLEVSCVVANEPPDAVRESFARAGVPLAVDASARQGGLAVFDGRVVWYGTLPLLAFPRRDDCSIRFASAQAAHDLLAACRSFPGPGGA